jgi:hypothetical protein
MSRRDRGEKRYPPRDLSTGQAVRVHGKAAGRMMTPAEVMMAIRAAELLNDADIRDIMIAGAQRLAAADPATRDGLGPCAILEPDERYEALAAVADMSVSRAIAWRKRNREMTWPELRVFLLGLRSASDA